jgi:hypothetical protein
MRRRRDAGSGVNARELRVENRALIKLFRLAPEANLR